ncbi:tail fiber domain-containing protein [Shewanella sp. SACH]|uniref:tail fiber domain-containing protein n=1 Tax=Shewanella sp. SACH TaxID=1873135 RepID=UPI00091EA858|nr:tail fiber domain-containing protein [Shewanella sp. SACH]
MHPLRNGSQATERPAAKPLTGLAGWFTESGDANRPSYPGADWFNHVIAEFLNILSTSGIVFDPETDTNLKNVIDGLARLTGADFSGKVKANGITSTAHYGGVIIGDNPIGQSGGDWPSTVGLRDATTVSRKLVNEPTDCHAFSDKTIIDNASDYGGYGAFDATTILRGDNTHNHVAAYQDRVQYQGDGILENSWGMIMWPTATGAGTIQKRVGLQIRAIETTTAVVESNRGIDINPKGSLNENIGIHVRNGSCVNVKPVSYFSAQDANGYSFYTNSFGMMHQKGKAGFGGVLPGDGAFSLNSAELGSAVIASLSSDDSNGAFVAVSGDNRVSFIANATLLGYWDVIAKSRAFSPATDNTQPNGQGIRRWSVIHAGTNAISTSDERLKSFLEIEQAEKDVAIKLKTMIRKFKFNESIKEKGAGARIHFGVNAQEVGQVFYDHGLDPHHYALFCHDSWDDQYVTEQINKGETIELTEIVDEPEFETVIEEYLELIINEKGEEEYKSVSKEVIRQKIIEVPDGLDEDGKLKVKKVPVMKKVTNQSTVMAEPVFEQILETAKGDRYGIRYEQLLAFIISAT